MKCCHLLCMWIFILQYSKTYGTEPRWMNNGDVFSNSTTDSTVSVENGTPKPRLINNRGRDSNYSILLNKMLEDFRRESNKPVTIDYSNLFKGITINPDIFKNNNKYSSSRGWFSSKFSIIIALILKLMMIFIVIVAWKYGCSRRNRPKTDSFEMSQAIPMPAPGLNVPPSNSNNDATANLVHDRSEVNPATKIV